MLAAGAGWMGCIAFLFNIFHLSSRSNVVYFERRLNKTERVWFRLANSNGSWQLLPGTSSPNTGLPLSGLRLPRTNATII